MGGLKIAKRSAIHTKIEAKYCLLTAFPSLLARVNFLVPKRSFARKIGHAVNVAKVRFATASF